MRKLLTSSMALAAIRVRRRQLEFRDVLTESQPGVGGRRLDLNPGRGLSRALSARHGR